LRKCTGPAHLINPTNFNTLFSPDRKIRVSSGYLGNMIMCQIYASTEPARYDSEARSLRIQGCVTSIRLEKEFWNILEEMAATADSSTPELINTLYTEVRQNFGEVRNFTSFLRTACTIYLARKGGNEQLPGEEIPVSG
jgi:predicted DNA-binding ribbon-helix-helix protein